MKGTAKVKIDQIGLHGILFSILLAVILLAPKFLFFGTLGYAVLTLVICLTSHRSFTFRKEYWLYYILYALYVVSLLWTENMEVGRRDVEYKMLLVAGPLILSYNKWNIKDFRTLIVGSNVVIFIAFLKAIGIYLNCDDPNNDCLSNDQNALGHHPTYMALYSVMAALMALYSFFYYRVIWSNSKFKLYIKIGTLGLFLTSSVYTYMVDSKAGVFGLFICVVLLVFTWVKSLKNKRIFRLSLVGLSLGILLVSYKLYQKPNYKQAVDRVIEYNQDNEYFRYKYGGTYWRQMESNTARILIWHISKQLMVRYPFGVGPGDVNDVLKAKYLDQNLQLLHQNGLNPHNQFVQIFLGLGILGFVLFSMIIGYSFLLAYERRFQMLGLLAVFILMNAMFESVLEHQHGVFFIVFFSLIFEQLSRNKVLAFER